MSRKGWTVAVAVCTVLAFPRTSSAEWWDYLFELSGPGPFASGTVRGLFSVSTRWGIDTTDLVEKAGANSAWDRLEGVTVGLLRFKDQADYSRTQLRADLIFRTGPLDFKDENGVDQFRTATWDSLEFAVERSWFAPGRYEIFNKSMGTAKMGTTRGVPALDFVRFFSSAGVSLNRFGGSGAEFEPFVRPSFKITPAGVMFKELMGLHWLGLEAAFNVHYFLDIAPEDFRVLGKTVDFKGGRELVRGYYINLFIDIGKDPT